MTRDNGISRRTAMKVTGAAAATTLVAGCGGNGDDDENGDDENGENGENGADGDGVEIEPGETIELDAQSGGWVGVAPDDIADEENPTLILQEGEEYEIGWEEGDGSAHNIEIVDEDDEVVDDLETDEENEGGDDQFLEFDASDEMAEYVCRPHENAMRGAFEIEEGENGADDEEEDDEENGADDEENGADDEENGADDEENGVDDENGADDEENGVDDENGADDEEDDDELIDDEDDE